MAEADTEHGAPGLDQSADQFGYIGCAGRIAGTVGNKDAVRMGGEDRLCGCGVRIHRAFATELFEDAQLVELDTAVDHGHFELRIRHAALWPHILFVDGHFRSEVAAHEPFGCFRFFNQAGLVEIFGGNHALHGALVADMQRDGTGIDLIYTNLAVFFKIVGQRLGCPPVAVDPGAFTDHKALGKNAARFGVFVIDAVVSNKGIGHGDDLSMVGGVGQNFLISGHGGVENQLTVEFSRSGKRLAFKAGAVFECNNRFFHSFFR